MAKRNALGRGLEALLGDINSGSIDMIDKDNSTDPQIVSDEKTQYIEIPINKIDPNQEQPRKDFDQEKLQELANSIQINGMIQPIIVKKQDNRYKIIAGERRWRAARLIDLKTVPVIIRNCTNQEIKEIALIENLQRDDLNVIEEAIGIQNLLQEHSLTQEEVAERLGKSRPAITNSLRLLRLPESILELLRNGLITSGHARCLLSLDSEEDQLELAKIIIDKELSVRDTELLSKRKREPKEKIKSTIPQQQEFQAAIQQLQLKFETKVKIVGNNKRGKINIEYYSEEQLEKIYEQLLS